MNNAINLKFRINSAYEIGKKELLEELKRRKDTPELGLESLPILNKKIWGIRRGRLTLIAARTSQGKSAFSLQIGYDLAQQGHEVLFLSLEMTNCEMVERLFCNACHINNYDLLTGKYLIYQNDYEQFLKELKDMPFIFSDCIGKTWREIDSLLTKMTKCPKVIILDYIQAVKDAQKEYLDDYIKNIREVAIRHNVAVILCSQINRTSQDSKDKQPGLHQLKGTGVLEEQADVAILLHWPYKYDNTKPKGEYHLLVEKNRSGATGYIKLKYSPEFYSFEDYVEEELSYQKVMGSLTESIKNDKDIDWED